MTRYVFLSLAFLFSQSVLFAQLGGAYTIGGIGGDYTDINSAISDLNSFGVNAPTIFKIRDGVYNEQLTINQIVGATNTNNVIFESESADSSAVIIEYLGTTSSENFVFNLDGADNIIIRNLTLKRLTAGNYGTRIIVLQNGANYNEISGVNCIGEVTSGTSNQELIYSPNTSDNFNIISHCSLKNGYYGVYLLGDDGNAMDSVNQVEHNIFINNKRSVEFKENYAPILHQNVISNSVSFTSCRGGLLASSNEISNNMNITQCFSTVADSILVKNNMIMNNLSNALRLFWSKKVYVINNTLCCKSTDLTRYALSVENASTDNSITYIYNNILINSGGGPALYFKNSLLNSDYNDLFSSGVSVVKNSFYTYPTFVDWQQANGINDANSLNIDPGFVGPDDLHIFSNFFLKNAGLDLNIMRDIDGDVRSTEPDIGADEFQLIDNDAGVTFIDLNELECSGSKSVNVNIGNFGAQNLTSADINWKVNGVTQSIFNWSGNLLSGDTSTLFSIGSIDILQDSIYEVVVWTENSNGVQEVILSNDTIGHNLRTHMRNHYTVGGIYPDYTTINQALADVIDRGSCDSVIFVIRPGQYREDLLIPNIPSKSNSWVVFQRDFTNNDTIPSEIYGFGGSVPVIQFQDSAQLILFRDLSIYKTDGDLVNNVSSGNGKRMNNVIFDNCVFSKKEEYGDDYCINLQNVSNITIQNCAFENSEYGVNISRVTYIPSDSILVTNNTFKNMERSNIGIVSYANATVSNNLITNEKDITPFSPYMPTGISVSQISGQTKISKNKITGVFGDGMYVSGSGTASNNIEVNNNFISCENINGSTGIYITWANYLRLSHNNVRISKFPRTASGGNAAAALKVINCSELSVVNNNFTRDYGQYLFQISTNSGVWQDQFSLFDYNNLYWNPSSSTAECNCTGWPSGHQANGVNIDPIYFSSTDLHQLNSGLLSLGLNQGIVEDFDGDIRPVTPSIGADEFENIALNLKPTYLSHEQLSCDSVEIDFEVTQFGNSIINTFTVEIDNDGIDSKTINWSGNLIPYDTTQVITVTIASNPDSVNTFSIVTSNPNSSSDDSFINDTANFNLFYTRPKANISGLGVVCPGDFVSLSVDTGYVNYLWSNGDMNNFSNVSTSGLYYIDVTDSIGCVKTDTFFVDTCYVPYANVPLNNLCFLDHKYYTKALPTSSLGTHRKHLLKDFNNDGLSDMVEARTDGKILFYINTGGDFDSPIIFNVPAWPQDVESADLNGDTFLDVVVVGSLGNCDVFYNNGSAVFTHVNHTIPYSSEEVEIGDVNNDGFKDVLFNNLNDLSISYMLSSAGGLAAPIVIDIDPTGVSGLITHDFNRDGNIDFSLGGAEWYSGDGLSSFVRTQTFQGGGLTLPSKGDVNNDGLMDIVGYIAGSRLATYVGTSQGIMKVGPQIDSRFVAIDAGFGNIKCKDVSGNGLTDLIVSGSDHNNLSIYFGRENAMPESRKTYQCGEDLLSVDAGEFNGDGITDIIGVSKDNNYQYINGLGNDHFEGIEHIDVPNVYSAYFMASADIDNDLDVDILAATSSDHGIFIYRNNGSGHFQLIDSLYCPTGVGRFVVKDINNDQLEDIITGGSEASIFINQGNGSFTLTSSITPVSLSSIYEPFLMDMNGDNMLDMVLVGSNYLEFYSGDQTGNFQFESQQSGNYSASYRTFIKQADFNNDGQLDLVITGGPGGDHVFVELNTSNFIFSETMYTPILYDYIEAIDISDVNHDGFDDIVLGVNWHVHFMTSDGSGNLYFNTQESIQSGASHDLEMKDITGDGMDDLVLATWNSGLVIYRQNSDYNFSLIHSSILGKYTEELNLADYDNDGDIDAAILSENTNQISINWNKLPGISLDQLPTDICTSEDEFVLSHGSPSGGAYYINGSYSTTFNAASLGPGSHSIIYKYSDQFGCGAEDTTTVNVFQLDNSVSISGDTLMANQIGVQYQWLDCISNTPISGETNRKFLMSNSGSYSVILDNGNCSDTSECFVLVSTIEQLGNNLISLAPNPTKGKFSLKINSLISETVTCRLFDKSGRECYRIEHTLNEGENRFNYSLKNLKSGAYYLRVDRKDSVQNLKVLFIR